ncbi:phage holin family protein [Ruicaihuangia caeni]|uniref:phage holin family protein n=1 Tax=Ruicaihuangia caeni TaxID=3042517 RepID=UPI00338D9812
MSDEAGRRYGSRRSLFQLISDLPGVVADLVRAEFALLKAEIVAKLKLAGIGVAFLLIAAVIVLLFVGVLLTAAIFALSLVMPGWLAALLVALLLLIVIAVLVMLGVRQLKQAMPPVPEQTIDSVKRDYFTIMGVLSRTSPQPEER